MSHGKEYREGEGADNSNTVAKFRHKKKFRDANMTTATSNYKGVQPSYILSLRTLNFIAKVDVLRGSISLGSHCGRSTRKRASGTKTASNSWLQSKQNKQKFRQSLISFSVWISELLFTCFGDRFARLHLYKSFESGKGILISPGVVGVVLGDPVDELQSDKNGGLRRAKVKHQTQVMTVECYHYNIIK